MKTRLALIVAALGLSSCASSGPQIVSGTPDHVSYKFTGDAVQQANQQATNYCSTFGKTAALQNVLNQGGQVVASYDCVQAMSVR